MRNPFEKSKLVERVLGRVKAVRITRGGEMEHPTIHLDGTTVEKMECFKFLGVHITDKLKWFTHTDSVVKKTQQRLFNLRRLTKV